MVPTRALDRFFEQKPLTAQRQLMDLWLSLPRGEERERIFFQYVCAPGTPEERLAALLAERATGQSKEVAA